MLRYTTKLVLQGLCIIVIAAVGSAAGVVDEADKSQSTIVVQETFDAQEFRGWSTQPSTDVPGVKGDLVSVEGSKPERRAARLGFAFAINDQDKVIPDTWKLVSSTFASNARPPKDAKIRVVFRARTSQPGRSVRVMLHDQHGETFATGTKRLTAEWQTIELALDGESVKHWGGDPGDGIVNWPLKLLAIEVIHWGGVSKEGREHLWIEDIQVLYDKLPQE